MAELLQQINQDVLFRIKIVTAKERDVLRNNPRMARCPNIDHSLVVLHFPDGNGSLGLVVIRIPICHHQPLYLHIMDRRNNIRHVRVSIIGSARIHVIADNISGLHQFVIIAD